MYPLTADENQAAARARAAIAAQIDAAGGWLSFERYMELALYAPGLGYYSAGAHKFGRHGDFTTAPEVSPLFGFCLARQCAEILEFTGGGSIVEIGAGTGRLMVDVMSRLEALGGLPDEYRILDVSADLRERQRRLARERIPHLLERVHWLDAPPTHAFDGVVIANEVLDALPVVRFRWNASGCEELGVARSAAGFAWASRPAGAALARVCDGLAAAAGGWDDGYVSEYCPRLGAWSTAMVAALRTGAALWIDYGLPRAQYYLPERHEGTLVCHFRQRMHDSPFERPGLEDISTWVDFTSLAEAAIAAGCDLGGFTTQAHFLAALGIDRELQTAAGGDETRFAALANQVKRLMLPGEMGERFKVMAWTRGMQRLSGFGLRDLRDSLAPPSANA